ncbi:MAG: SIMPL domain-containing protein, partial [Longimicrobiales bacterium]
TDAFANIYSGGQPIRARYVVNQTVMVRSTNVDLVLRASVLVGELVSAGVVLSASQFGPGFAGPTFLFTRLNDLKPEMIREATASAREAAEQFAADSRSRLGGIRQANQGVFVILPRDQAPGIQEQTQLFKTVRVVSTVEYYLRD